MIAMERADYETLIEAAVDRERDIVGHRAIDLARSVEGLSVDDDGAVRSVDRDGKAVLGELIDAYVAASGDVAAFLIARRIENLPHDDLDLPENLAAHV